ncbi:hypothetical protein Tco_0667778 [Tanacetum coccineum]
MASLDHRLNPLFSIKECMTCGALYTADFCCSKGGLEDKILVPKSPQNCATCGNPIDGLYCRHCVFMRKCLNEGLVGKRDHIWLFYNCPPKAPIISNPEQCNQTINELPQTLPSVHPTCNYEDENSFTYDSKPNSFNDSPNILTHPPQLQFELCGNNAHYGYDCQPQFPLVYEQERIARDNFLKDVYTFLRKFSRISFGVTPKVILIAWESFGEIKDALMDKQYRQEDINEIEALFLSPHPNPSGSKGVSDDICDNNYSDAESLLSQNIPITSPKIGFLSKEFAGEFAPIPPEMDENKVDCYDHEISSDDDSYENIEYVKASPLNLEYDNVILHEKLLNVHRLITNIESLKNNPTPDFVFKSPFSFPIPVMDSGSFFEESDTFLSHSDKSLPEFETFNDYTEETRSGSTTTHAINSLPEYDSFLFEIEPNQGGLTSVVISDNSNDPLLELPEFESFHFDLDPSFPRPPPEPPDVEISLIIETDAHVINDFDELNEDECFDPGGGEINVEVDDSFTFVTWTFLPFFTYPEVSPLLSSNKK